MEGEIPDAADHCELSDVCTLLAEMIGPDSNAMLRFQEKEGEKFDKISTRLNELLVLIEEMMVVNQFGNPEELVAKLNSVFASVDAIADFVSDVKKRLQQLEKEIENHRPNKLLGLFKKKKEEPQPMNFDGVMYETDELMTKYGLAVAADESTQES